MLIIGTIGGILMATVLNNGGGAWDNAKKFIESGGLKDEKGNVLGKGSEAHKAAVVGDTIGDPFKDTAGPSLHVLIKLLATITLVLAPLFIDEVTVSRLQATVRRRGLPIGSPLSVLRREMRGCFSLRHASRLVVASSAARVAAVGGHRARSRTAPSAPGRSCSSRRSGRA